MKDEIAQSSCIYMPATCRYLCIIKYDATILISKKLNAYHGKFLLHSSHDKMIHGNLLKKLLPIGDVILCIRKDFLEIFKEIISNVLTQLLGKIRGMRVFYSSYSANNYFFIPQQKCKELMSQMTFDFFSCVT